MSGNKREKLWIERFIFNPVVGGWLLCAIMLSAIMAFGEIDGERILFVVNRAMMKSEITVGYPALFCIFFMGPIVIAATLMLRKIMRDVKQEEDLARLKKEFDTFQTIVSEVTTSSSSSDHGDEMVFRANSLMSIEWIARLFVAVMREVPLDSFTVIDGNLLPLFMRRGVRASQMVIGEFDKLIAVLQQPRKFASGKGLDDVAKMLIEALWLMRCAIDTPSNYKPNWFDSDVGQKWLERLDRIAPPKE